MKNKLDVFTHYYSLFPAFYCSIIITKYIHATYDERYELITNYR